MRRNILTWRILNYDMVGTHHVPTETGIEDAIGAQCIGVLLLNAGPAPRSGNSDLPAHIGDRLASRGIPVFRFNLPGLGDSSGSTPAEFGAYWQEVLRGRNDDVTLKLVVRLKQDFELSGVIVGGLCAAAVPTLRVADKVAAVAGVILMEPALRFGKEYLPATHSNTNIFSATKVGMKLRRLFSVREWFGQMLSNNGIAKKVRPLKPYLARIQLLLFGHTLYGDMNVPLFMHWRNIHVRGTPSLVIVAEGQEMDRCVGLVMDSLPAKGSEITTLIRVPHTNHILTGGQARDIVLDAVCEWSLTKCKQTVSYKVLPVQTTSILLTCNIIRRQLY